MKIEIDTVKGFQDFLPPKSLKRQAVKNIIEKWFKLYGFLPIETPLIEFDESMRSDALASETEDQAISDRFRLQDRGGRNLGLRYEFTFQLARIFKQNPVIKLPFKRYQIGEVLRDEPVSITRFRQFTQCDIDIVGDSSTNADAECLACFSDILKELKIPFEIQVNNRALLDSIIDSVEIGNKRSVLKELDKIDKLGADEVKNNLRKYTSANQIITLFKILEKPVPFFKQNAFSGIEQLEDLIETCLQYGIKVKFNPFLARGLSYYTGNIFEILSTESDSSIAGGGRYDNTVGKYLSNNLPATGISFGLERVTTLAQIIIPDPVKALLISISQDKITISLAKKLRKTNIPCSISFSKIGKSLEYANAQKIPYAILIGEEETSKKKYKLKDMESGKETILTEEKLIKALAK